MLILFNENLAVATHIVAADLKLSFLFFGNHLVHMHDILMHFCTGKKCIKRIHCIFSEMNGVHFLTDCSAIYLLIINYK